MPERPRRLKKRSKPVSPGASTKEQIEPLQHAGMSGGETAKQLGVAPYVVFNGVYRLWPEFGANIKRIRESFGATNQ